MKIIAFYLPQFHCFPENDEWWGKGFTEWTNVKKAKPLFKGHRQPRIPLDENYYNLDDVKVMESQSAMAKRYGIDAFCFYHYWFNGKKLMEKPVEQFLSDKNCKIEFCFSWANEPWTRSWDGKKKSILMPQKYDDPKDIKNHFLYLLPFFSDVRYLKINNSPVFVIYRANNIPCLEEMIDVWNEMAKEAGFNGIYFIETLTGFQKKKESKKTQALVYMEPMFVIGIKSKIRKFLTAWRNPIKMNRREDYESVWKRIIKFEKLSEEKNAGAFVDWDNSARKKKQNLILTNVKINSFYNFFLRQYKRAISANCNFLFINAWNEWAEGTYLEPDEDFKYSYLNAIKEIVLKNEK